MRASCPEMSSWWATLAMAVTFLGMWRPVTNCHSDSRELHVCLNVFLERDFSTLENIVTPRNGLNRGRMIIEGPDLENICNRVLELQDCFKELVFQCITYNQMFKFDRMLYVLKNVHQFLCNGSDFKMKNLKDLLLNGACIEFVRKSIADCDGQHTHGVSVWKKVLRLQVDKEICEPIKRHVHCLVIRLQRSQCAPEAALVYNNTMNTWLHAWCHGTAIINSPSLLIMLIPMTLAFITYS